jgi:hypothetical protein
MKMQYPDGVNQSGKSGLTVYRRDHISQTYNPTPTIIYNANTLAVRNTLSAVSANWKNLTLEQRQQWTEYSRNYFRLNSFQLPKKMPSGLTMFNGHNVIYNMINPNTGRMPQLNSSSAIVWPSATLGYINFSNPPLPSIDFIDFELQSCTINSGGTQVYIKPQFLNVTTHVYIVYATAEYSPGWTRIQLKVLRGLGTIAGDQPYDDAVLGYDITSMYASYFFGVMPSVGMRVFFGAALVEIGTCEVSQQRLSSCIVS